MPRIPCPFCNTSFEPTGTVRGRVVCPRCDGASNPPVGLTLPEQGAPPPVAADSPRGRNWAVLVGLFVVTAAVMGGVFAFATRNRRPDPAPKLPGAAVAPPAQLRGLAYLPAESNVVFAVQPAAVFRHATAHGLNPAEEMAKAGVPAGVLAPFAAGGVSLDAIDHVVGGAVIPEAGELRLGVALVLRVSIPDEAKFLDALKARGAATGTPPHHVVEFGGVPLRLTKMNETVWLLGWSEDDLAPAGNGLAERMRAALAETFAPDTAACLLTDEADWAAKPSVALLLTLGGKADWKAGLANVRAVAAGVTLTDPPTLRVMARPAGPAARESLTAAFRRQPGTTGETGGWVQLDAPADRAGGLAALRTVLAPK